MHPELLSSLIVLVAPLLGVATLTNNRSLTQAIKSWYILYFHCPLLPEWMLTRDGCSFLDDALLKAPMGLKNPTHMTTIDVEILKQSFRENGTAAATHNTYRALFANATYCPSKTIWDAMRQRVRVPVLLLWAEDDAALGLGMTKGIDQVVEDLEMKVLENCSHWIQLQTSHMMANFLARRRH
jgi:pimeloyl-ACP methyl ester carboxylesterase